MPISSSPDGRENKDHFNAKKANKKLDELFATEPSKIFEGQEIDRYFGASWDGDHSARIYVHSSKRKEVGWIKLYGPNDIGVAYISDIQVLENERRKGIASRLLDFIEQDLALINARLEPSPNAVFTSEGVVLMKSRSTESELIAMFNDRLRRTLQGGKLVMTSSLKDEPGVVEIISKIRKFTKFDASNDPYGEHDFGAVEHKGEKYFWKIDAYDENQQYGSEDPSNPLKTTRVMTIMRSSEY